MDGGRESAHARELLTRAERPLVYTGAGVSAESGVPTFRGPGGLWRSFRPEDIATPEAFARDPDLVREWYAWRRSVVAGCVPNAAHLAIADWMRRRADVTLVTQNVDDLHERAARAAGADDGPPRLLKLHGALFRDRCGDCGAEHLASGEATPGVPSCPACGGALRPAVVWFGEALPADVFRAASTAAGAAGAVLVIGTAGAVHPAAGLVGQAHAAGAAVIVVDPGPTAFDAMAACKLAGPAARLVPGLLGAAPVPGLP